MPDQYPASRQLGDDDIRLVRILAGDWTDDIRCELLPGNLRDRPAYQALSYVWGSPNNKRPIWLNDLQFEVTINLESALRHLRCQVTGTLLWIDALCINQKNVEEQTHQVQMMGRIYSSCEGVLVYLGDGIGRRLLRNHQPKIFEFGGLETPLHDFTISRRTDSLDLPGMPSNPSDDPTVTATVNVFALIDAISRREHLADTFKISDFDNNAAQSLCALSENLRRLMHAPFTPWWTRVWVIQEIILPPSVRIFCGTVSAPWIMFAKAALNYLQHIDACCQHVQNVIPRDALNVLGDFSDRIQDIEDLRYATVRNRGAFATDLHVRSHQNKAQGSLYGLLQRFRDRKATDPRDKVYALLSLVVRTSDRPPILPDYSLDEINVHMIAAVDSIYSTNSLSILNAVGMTKYRFDLPTWVPDWNAPEELSFRSRKEAMGLYNSWSQAELKEDSVRQRDKSLHVRGICVGLVSQLSQVMLHDSAISTREIIMHWLLKREVRNDTENMDGFSGLRVFKTLCAGVTRLPHAADSQCNIRRFTHSDELSFCIWARLSQMSPFLVVNLDRQTFPVVSQLQTLTSNLELSLSIHHEVQDHRFIADVKDFLSDRNIFGDQFADSNTFEKLVHLFRQAMNITLAGEESLRLEFALQSSEIAASIAKIRTWLQASNLSNRAKTGLQENIEQSRRLEKLMEAQEELPQKREQVLRRHKIETAIRSLFLFESTPSPHDVRSQEVISASLNDSIKAATNSRRFFDSRAGVWGLGPAGMSTSDVIFLLQGGDTPFILRPNNDLERRCYTVVGDCYVDGLMHVDEVQEYLSKRKRREPGLCYIDLVELI
ncbi:hypothetical protein NX059_000888 [Plenodomus lindquistii]|nr:hypothetical protein NX059_000888 [Plenodomus lindquistii]